MPERPDLEYVVPALEAGLAGRQVAAVEVHAPVVLRMGLRGGPAAALVGRRFERVHRHGHFVVLELDVDVDVVVSPMLAGRFQFALSREKRRADTCLSLVLDDGRVLRYRDDVKMGKVYVFPRPERGKIPGFLPLGCDVLDERAFTRETFRALARGHREQLKVFLMDRSVLDAMGNAYADEVCWHAGIHPKVRVASLDSARLDRVHASIVAVLTHARDEIARRAPALDEKVRDFLSVRGRAGQPCPRCGTVIRSAGVHGHDADFCPRCQPDDANTALVDWRSIPGKRD